MPLRSRRGNGITKCRATQHVAWDRNRPARESTLGPLAQHRRPTGIPSDCISYALYAHGVVAQQQQAEEMLLCEM
ncbi:hypothetical protein O9K51_00734 [Purpureocillium lavendulum]|uniref:Uncharacterized protein n=1 Tax=Purpureocillium lavendulum TaxID=1247861 RepID=A0AB34G5E3_9HYPO|nr:hypothetical protein O9K51_00734 [Purpureocillium lavendulum]